MGILVDMNPAGLKQAVADGLALLVPTGSVEYHGGQLPLGTDLFITDELARAVERRTPCVVAPAIAVVPTGYMVSGAELGTADISVDAFCAYCREVLQSYVKMGFARVIVLVHHQAGNIGAFIKTAVAGFTEYGQSEKLGGGWWTERKQPEAIRIEICPAMLDTQFFGGHGGKGETEAVMALRPELVHMENMEQPPVWWNESAVQADPAEANRQLAELLDRWDRKLRSR